MPPRKQRAAPAPPDKAPFIDPGFERTDTGHVTWKVGDTTYRLRPLLALEYIDLDGRRQDGAEQITNQLLQVRAMPSDTHEEREARRAAMAVATTANNEWVFSWWEQLFAFTETEGRPFPKAEAPASIFQAGSMMVMLGHLQGPHLPGVS